MNSRVALCHELCLPSTAPRLLCLYDWGWAWSPAKFNRAIDKPESSLDAVRAIKSDQLVSFREGMVGRVIKSA
jgi:hypothetical protein